MVYLLCNEYLAKEKGLKVEMLYIREGGMSKCPRA
jgi:hypothetical protein